MFDMKIALPKNGKLLARIRCKMFINEYLID